MTGMKTDANWRCQPIPSILRWAKGVDRPSMASKEAESCQDMAASAPQIYALVLYIVKSVKFISLSSDAVLRTIQLSKASSHVLEYASWKLK